MPLDIKKRVVMFREKKLKSLKSFDLTIITTEEINFCIELNKKVTDHRTIPVLPQIKRTNRTTTN